MDEFYNKTHKFPKGLRQRLADLDSNGRVCCPICWSTMRVAIHHYSKDATPENYRYRTDEKGNIRFDDLSNFILLCGSCHAKIEACLGHYWQYRNQIPIIKLMNEIIEKRNVLNIP